MSRVLLVHADDGIGARLAATLDAAGLTTHLVTSGERAMDEFIQEPADVVVVDYHLDGRDGVSTAEAIRWMPGGRRARVILMAERDPDEGGLADLGQAVDAFATLIGPIDPGRLRAMVERAAAVRPHEAETRILSTEQALLSAERARDPEGSERRRIVAAERPDGTRSFSEVSISVIGAGRPETDAETLDEPAPEPWELDDADGAAEGREVRAMAEAVREADSDMFGSFERIDFARLLHRLAEQRATGALICSHPPDERATTSGTEPTKVVYFRAGVPVHVRSNLVSECLGQVLARQRRIGPATLEESIEAVRRGEGRQGEVLVAMGALGPLELSEALVDQLRVKLFELFAWKHGSFHFAAGRAPPRELIDLELGLAEIAWEGVRQAVPPTRALSVLSPHRERFVVPRPRGMVRFVRLRLPPPLDGLVSQIRGDRTLRELLAASGAPGAAAQLVYAMSSLDAVRFEDAPLRPAPPRVAPAVEVVAPAVEAVAPPAAPLVASLPSVPDAAVLAESVEASAEGSWSPPSRGWEPADAGWGEATPVETASSRDDESGEVTSPAPDEERGARGPRDAAPIDDEAVDAPAEGAIARSAVHTSPPARGVAPETSECPGDGAPRRDAPEANDDGARDAWSESSELRSGQRGADRRDEPPAAEPPDPARVVTARRAEEASRALDEAAEQIDPADAVTARRGEDASRALDQAAEAFEPPTDRARPALAPRPRLGGLARASETPPAAASTGAVDEAHAPVGDERPHPRSNGSTPDGALSDGALSDGALSDGALSDGALSDGALRGGSRRDEAMSDGSISEASIHGGSTPAGSTPEGSTSDSTPDGSRSDATPPTPLPAASPSLGPSAPTADAPPLDAPPAPTRAQSVAVLDARVDRLLRAERHARRAQHALDRQRPEEALAALERALALCPDEGKFVVLTAWARHAAAPDDAFVLSEALAQAERGSSMDPELVMGHLLRARLLLAMGREADAREAYARAHALDPADEEARAGASR